MKGNKKETLSKPLNWEAVSDLTWKTYSTGLTVHKIPDGDGKRIYIAGPISSRLSAGERLNAIRETFYKTATYLHSRGWKTVNPFDLHAEDLSWETCLRSDIPGLVKCDAIYLLKGYATSKGARLELHIARAIKMQEFYEDHPETVCEEADRIVSGDRGPQYGHPAANFTMTADLWNAWLKPRFDSIDLEPEDVAAMMVLLKMARQSNRPKRDNLTDVCGYTKTWDMVNEARERGEIPDGVD